MTRDFSASFNIIHPDSKNNRKAWDELLSILLHIYLGKMDGGRGNYLKSLI